MLVVVLAIGIFIGPVHAIGLRPRNTCSRSIPLIANGLTKSFIIKCVVASGY